MPYVERPPIAPLRPFVASLWHNEDATAVAHPGRQRVLPTGRMELLFNLAADYLTDLSDDAPRASAPALLVGLHRHYQTIATADLAALAGVSFQPGGFAALFGLPAHEFAGAETPLPSVLGPAAESLRTHLRELPTPPARLALLEAFLLTRLRSSPSPQPSPLTIFAQAGIAQGQSIATLTRHIGLSPRLFRERFRREVGAGPKTYARIVRFQAAVQRMHHGREIPWAELALACGFYDQAHFTHEFRAFSGLCPTEYRISPRPWASHIELPAIEPAS